ncbi:hypothetical protein ACIP5Y_35405 [Nocardia sp. NPDC088792]|uniref:hypothetical protein n=1 Tax=Nocardia sp. NPDC088792 TaxID=3364332 RepID=UPI0037FF544E
MSESSVVSNRTRRRAVRSEGPPPEEQDAATQAFVTTVPVPEGRSTTGQAAATESATVHLDKAQDSPNPQPPVADAKPAEDGAEATAASGSAPESEAPAVASADRGSLWMRVVAIAALVLAVAVVGGTVWAVHERDTISAQDTLRGEYMQAARQAMLNITNISADTASDDINRVLQVTSGDLNKEYNDRKNDYMGIVQKAQVRAKGEVIESAVQTMDDHSAIVLVAVKQTLTNAGADGPQERQYRFKVSLARDAKGITATGMEMTV